jgi:hypothetical protein
VEEAAAVGVVAVAAVVVGVAVVVVRAAVDAAVHRGKRIFPHSTFFATAANTASSGGRGSSSDNSGGRTTTGTGPRPAYGGGAYYGGGSTVPYKSGGRSPKGMVPLFAGVAFLAVFPGLWLSGAYLYNYHNPYRFYNQTSEQDESKAVTCACEPELPCACEENEDNKHIDELVGNGSYSALNHSLITVANIDGTETIVINGTLPSGTTAAGGTDEPGSGDGGSGDTNAGNGGLRALLQHAGWWPAAAAVAAIVLTA